MTPDSSSPQSSRPTRALRILVVEDHDDSRDLLMVYLADAGYLVQGASTAAEGLERLREAPRDVVIADYNLGEGETGATLLERAQAEGLLDGALVAFLWSAHPFVTVPASVPCARGLPKPLDVEALRVEIERLAREAGGR